MPYVDYVSKKYLSTFLLPIIEKKTNFNCIERANERGYNIANTVMRSRPRGVALSPRVSGHPVRPRYKGKGWREPPCGAPGRAAARPRRGAQYPPQTPCPSSQGLNPPRRPKKRGCRPFKSRDAASTSRPMLRATAPPRPTD
jgi:hypothetical protein